MQHHGEHKANSQTFALNDLRLPFSLYVYAKNSMGECMANAWRCAWSCPFALSSPRSRRADCQAYVIRQHSGRMHGECYAHPRPEHGTLTANIRRRSQAHDLGNSEGKAKQAAKQRPGIPLKRRPLPNAGGTLAEACSIGTGLAGSMVDPVPDPVPDLRLTM